MGMVMVVVVVVVVVVVGLLGSSGGGGGKQHDAPAGACASDGWHAVTPRAVLRAGAM